MIKGVGTDICDIARIRKMVESDKKDLFLPKIFTTTELQMAEAYKDPSAFFAGRWAAKEALAKALGTGFGKQCRWLDIEVQRLESGAPDLVLSELTKETADSLSVKTIHLSISHEKETAVAFVVLEA